MLIPEVRLLPGILSIGRRHRDAIGICGPNSELAHTKDNKQLQSWLGFVNYYRSFTKDFSVLTVEMNAQHRENAEMDRDHGRKV